MNLSEILRYTDFLNKYQEVKRGLHVTGQERMESDVEHSYQLAMLAWYFAERCEKAFNGEKLLKYALIHDLVEVYAGDTYFYSEDQVAHDSKHDREEAARIRIEGEYPLLVNSMKALKSMKREDEESKLIYVLDKLHPIFQIYLDKGRNWKEKGITLELLIEKKEDKMNLCPELLPIWNELKEILIKEKEELFTK